jgi:ABC-2 type transport system permease protein
LIVLIGSFKPHDPAFAGHHPSDYYLASYIGVVIGAIGLIALPVHLASYRERGVLHRFQASSIPTRTVAAAHVITGLDMATIGAVVLILDGKLIYGADLPHSVGSVIGSFLLATLAFQAAGFLIGSVMHSARGAQAVGMLLFFPMWLLSGAAPPPSVMSAGMRHLSDVLPLTFAVRAIQHPWLGSPANPLDILLLAGILGAAGALTIQAARTSWRTS